MQSLTEQAAEQLPVEAGPPMEAGLPKEAGLPRGLHALALELVLGLLPER